VISLSPPDSGKTPVLIIGGGAAGLSTAASLAKHGIRSTVIDRNDQIGDSWTRRYKSLRLHTIRRYSGLAHYPIPGDRPRYLSKDEYAAYLKEYAKVFELDVSLGELVNAVQQSSGNTGAMEWEVVTNRGTRRAGTVVIATGHYAEPFMPTWEGVKRFSGVLLHSAEYIEASAFSGQNVLVIGLGNSGAEIAAELAARGAASVSVSVRSVPPIVTREMFKIIPVQLFGIALTPVEMPRVLDCIGTALRRISIGDLTVYGLGQAEWGPFTARKPAVIDAGFVKQLKQGRVAIRPEIARFDETGVIYADGKRDALDVVISATGFRTGLDRILRVPGIVDGTGQHCLRSGGPASAPGLYFVGFDETIRGHLFEINRESKQIAVEIKRYLMRLQ